MTDSTHHEHSPPLRQEAEEHQEQNTQVYAGQTAATEDNGLA